MVSLSACGMRGIFKGAGFSAIREEKEGGEVPEEMKIKKSVVERKYPFYLCMLSCMLVCCVITMGLGSDTGEGGKTLFRLS